MANSAQKNSTLVPIIIIAGLFFIFGFVTWINGALIPFMKTINELTDAESYLVASASYISFVVMALPASSIINKIGYKKGMSLGLIIMAIGALVFIPAANARTYWMFLTAIFIQGAGMTLLQTASNPYITILGPIESAAKRIAIMGIANKVAGSLGSVIFGAILLSGIDEIKDKLSVVDANEKASLLDTMADSVVTPYIAMAVVLFILGILIRKAPLPHVEAAPIEENTSGAKAKSSIFQFPHLWLGVLALFVYVGVEVVAGDTIIAYGISLDIPVEQAKFFTLFTLMAMVATYALGVILIPKYISQAFALKASAILGILLSFCIVFTSGFTSVLFVAALGIANALVWPAIWPLALTGMGKFTKTASALLIMAISGGAIIPPLYGALVDNKKESLMVDGVSEVSAMAEAASFGYWILLPCYLIIFYYAFWGHKVGLKSIKS
ncbi:sugar MFS transporter [Polaribacter dokdonensis]|uniref:Glucose/galactose transporter n=1 Tax=Polaribacter dokdonensis DSW-5 TaxID=1300348 RepID=A0A0M9CGJ0_9FLAO|nr:sugar MFS transporter [Polaribacter dokdonensis]KOY51709.1 Glucose/galactose transporter [Polaribacter dokdonensis DSW-5]SEE04955.1 glucose/galactose transporter [Polaribacter dokdonensis DSW-5]